MKESQANVPSSSNPQLLSQLKVFTFSIYQKTKQVLGLAYDKTAPKATIFYQKTKEISNEAYQKTKQASGYAYEKSKMTGQLIYNYSSSFILGTYNLYKRYEELYQKLQKSGNLESIDKGQKKLDSIISLLMLNAAKIIFPKLMVMAKSQIITYFPISGLQTFFLSNAHFIIPIVLTYGGYKVYVDVIRQKKEAKKIEQQGQKSEGFQDKKQKSGHDIVKIEIQSLQEYLKSIDKYEKNFDKTL